jgi:hypothetical protein
MAGKVFFSVSMSLDGFIAPLSVGDLMGPKWMGLHAWVFPQRFFDANGVALELVRAEPTPRVTHLVTP